MIALRLDLVAMTPSGRAAPAAPLDRALALVDDVTLVRSAEGCTVQVRAADAAVLIRALAFAGIAARASGVDVSVPTGHVPAVGADLAPVPIDLLGCDVVRVRRLTIGEATAEVLRRRFAALRDPSPAARERCRRLLRGEDALLAWDRRAWLPRAALRSARSRSCLRPVVFDRDAIERDDRPGRSFASQGALAAWAFG